MKREKITSKTISSLQPGETVFDTELRRFGARCRTTGITYFVKVVIDGHQRWISVGRDGPLTPSEARSKAKRTLAEIDAGSDPTRERSARKRMPTFAELAEKWINEHVSVKRKPSTASEYKRVIEKHLSPRLGTTSVDRIDRTDIRRLHASLAKTPYLANRVVAVASAIMTFAEDCELRPPSSNPCRRLERYSERRRKRPLTPDELRKFWQYLQQAEAREGPYVIAAFRLLLLTGMRKMEILRLKWNETDLRRGVLTLHDTKTGPREIVLSQAAANLLAELPKTGSPYVIVGARADGHLVNLAKPWKRACEALALQGVRIHDLRHTAASMLARLAAPIVVRDALGHALLETTSGYMHSASDDVRDALNKLSAEITMPGRLL